MNRINTKLLAILFLIFLPFVITCFIAFNTFSNMEDDGVAINLSGSQRMRTMLISNYSLQIYEKNNAISDIKIAKKTLSDELAKYDKIMNALVDGDEDLLIGRNKDANIVTAINNVMVKTEKYEAHAYKILNNTANDADMMAITSSAMEIKDDIHIIVGMYQENYNNKVDNFKVILIALATFGLVVLVFGYSFGKRIIVNPIVNISSRLGEISKGEGDLTNELPVTSKDEIGQLSDNFNKFVGTIRDMVVEISASSDNLDGVCNSLDTITDEVNVSSEKLSTITSDIAEGASNQAEEVITTAENLAELGYHLDDINDLSNVMKDSSENIKKINDISKESMIQLQKSNGENIEASHTINDAIITLHEKVKKISEITGVISGISEQTNLLALNASIEAARAGEHGRGFAVVAQEVSKLADESSKSTVEISAIVEDIQRQVTQTKDIMSTVLSVSVDQSKAVENSKNDFVRVTESIDDMLVKIDSINQRIENVDNKKNEILDAIQNVSSVSEETAASTEEVAAFTDEFQASVNEIAMSAKTLRESSANLTDMIGKFKY